MRKIINDDVEALTRKPQARFQVIQVFCSARLNNLKTSLRFPCLGLNPIIDSIDLEHVVVIIKVIGMYGRPYIQIHISSLCHIELYIKAIPNYMPFSTC